MVFKFTCMMIARRVQYGVEIETGEVLFPFIATQLASIIPEGFIFSWYAVQMQAQNRQASSPHMSKSATLFEFLTVQGRDRQQNQGAESRDAKQLCQRLKAQPR